MIVRALFSVARFWLLSPKTTVVPAMECTFPRTRKHDSSCAHCQSAHAFRDKRWRYHDVFWVKSLLLTTMFVSVQCDEATLQNTQSTLTLV